MIALYALLVLDAVLARWPAELASAPDALKLGISVYNVTLRAPSASCVTKDP